MQINAPPNTESVEITIIEEEQPQSNWWFSCFRFCVRGYRILTFFVVISCVICLSVCLYLLVTNDNGESTSTTTTQQSITDAMPTAKVAATATTTTKYIDGDNI